MDDSNLSLSDFANICRICFCKEYLNPLILEATFNKIFSILTEIKINQDDLLPKNICFNCETYLKDIETFSNKCKASEALLRKISGITEPETLAEDINETKTSHEKKKTETNKSDRTVKKKRVKKTFVINDNKLVVKKRGPKAKVDGVIEPKPVCQTCGTTFNTKVKLCQHYKDNEACKPNGYKFYNCEICDKKFSTLSRRNEHMNIHTGETPYICVYCGKGFQQYPAHFKHIYRHKLALGEVELKPGYIEKRVKLNLQCELCPKVFASRSGFANHRLMHQGIKIKYKKPVKTESEKKLKNFLCNYCPKNFRTKVQLDRHIQNHTGSRPLLECSFCGKFLKTKFALKVHEQNHTGTTPRRFECEVCKKPFSMKSHYEAHKRTHTGEKPFECSYCGKCFSYRGTWKIHIRIHTGETPYACPVCDNRYHDKSSLNKHQKKKRHWGDDNV